MRITFDYSRTLDHAYLQIGEARPVAESVELEGRDDIRLDLDEDGLVVGVAFTEASKSVPLAGPDAGSWDEQEQHDDLLS